MRRKLTDALLAGILHTPKFTDACMHGYNKLTNLPMMGTNSGNVVSVDFGAIDVERTAAAATGGIQLYAYNAETGRADYTRSEESGDRAAIGGQLLSETDTRAIDALIGIAMSQQR